MVDSGVLCLVRHHLTRVGAEGLEPPHGPLSGGFYRSQRHIAYAWQG